MTGEAALAALAFVLFGLAPGIITLLKGQYVLFVAGLVVPSIVWVIAACRLARPNSAWARWFYAEKKRVRSRARYPAHV